MIDKRNTLIKGLSLFSNVGIAETYLGNQGIEIVLANEIVEKSTSYSHMYPNTEMIRGDIQEQDVKDILIKKHWNTMLNLLLQHQSVKVCLLLESSWSWIPETIWSKMQLLL